MNLLARILSHGFGLIVVAMLVIALIYRGELFPEWELPDFLALDTAPEQAADTVSGEVKRDGEPAAPGELPDMTAAQETTPEATPSADAAITDGTPAGDSVPAATETAPEMVEAEPAATEVDAEAAGEAVVPATATADGGQPADVSAAETPPAPVTTPAADEVPTPAAAATVAETPPAPVTTPAADEVPAPAGMPQAVPEATSYRVLAAAREAYWLRDYALAEQKYRDLIALEPDNPDGYGELGNMYFSRGAWEQASAAYYEAGVRLLDQGYITEARQLVEVIRGLNGSQADALAEKVESAELGAR